MDNSLNNIKAIVFDFDDTLGNRNRYAYDYYDYFMSKNVEGFNDDPILKEAILQDMMIWDQHSFVPKKTILEKVEETYHLPVKDLNVQKDFEENIYQFVRLSDDALTVIKTLKDKGYKLGILTNGTKDGQRKKITTAIDLSLFDSVIISGDYGYKKPDIRLFNECIRQLNVLPEEIMFVGDSFGKDILGAYRAGMKPVWIWPNDGRIQNTSIPRIYEIKEILNLL